MRIRDVEANDIAGAVIHPVDDAIARSNDGPEQLPVDPRIGLGEDLPPPRPTLPAEQHRPPGLIVVSDPVDSLHVPRRPHPTSREAPSRRLSRKGGNAAVEDGSGEQRVGVQIDRDVLAAVDGEPVLAPAVDGAHVGHEVFALEGAELGNGLGFARGEDADYAVEVYAVEVLVCRVVDQGFEVALYRGAEDGAAAGGEVDPVEGVVLD